MIKSTEDYYRFLQAELGFKPSRLFLLNWKKTIFKPIKRFLLLLRTCEYYSNTKKGLHNKCLYFIFKYFKYRLGMQLGFTIPENVADEGLQLPHYGTIVVNANARIGKNCKIHVCVNIGASGGSNDAPKIGSNVYIAPGAKIFGGIEIADNIAISANSVVNKSLLNSNMLVGGVPAREIKPIDVLKLL